MELEILDLIGGAGAGSAAVAFFWWLTARDKTTQAGSAMVMRHADLLRVEVSELKDEVRQLRAQLRVMHALLIEHGITIPTDAWVAPTPAPDKSGM